MSNTVKVPLFLQPGKARELTDKLIRSTQTCPFFGVPDILIAHHPDSYADAFTIYITGLYVLYFDCGGGFMENYFCGDADFRNHIDHIKSLRIALTHMPTTALKKKALDSLKKYILLDSSIIGWDDYLNKMSEADWREAVDAIIVEANRLYNILDAIDKSTAPNISINSYKNAVAKRAVHALTICYKATKASKHYQKINQLEKKLITYSFSAQGYTDNDLDTIAKTVFSPNSFVQNNSVEKLLSCFSRELYAFYDSKLSPSSSSLAKKLLYSN